MRHGAACRRRRRPAGGPQADVAPRGGDPRTSRAPDLGRSGAVRLIAAHPAEQVLLLERLDGDRTLNDVPILEACEVIGRLFGELDRPAPPQIPPLATKAIRWRGQFAALPPLVPRRLVEQAASTLDDLLLGPAPARLVHEDLHDANVLAATRAEWLAIDPKPVSGEWAYAVAPIVWNRAG
ncbi:aminoglycoside phosphotransferase family protein [Tessaracoccus coleopterorum]|uniref:aminoglycoside phosphotransferase family protein n=1 Tax=Tessaracoccus coleopterorum TaxID=2714950 RepID=UPI002F90E0CC